MICDRQATAAIAEWLLAGARVKTPCANPGQGHSLPDSDEAGLGLTNLDEIPAAWYNKREQIRPCLPTHTIPDRCASRKNEEEAIAIPSSFRFT